MFYCPNCNNIYDIAKSIQNISPQNPLAGGAVSDTPDAISSTTNTVDEIQLIIDYISKNNAIKLEDLKGYAVSDILQSDQYKKMQPKLKNNVAAKLNQLDKPKDNTTQNAYFICKNCGNHEVMKPNTLITRKNYGDTAVSDEVDEDHHKDMAAVKCIPVTRNYVCNNAKCESHKNYTKRRAKFYRIQGSFIVRYVCLTCNESWTA